MRRHIRDLFNRDIRGHNIIEEGRVISWGKIEEDITSLRVISMSERGR